MASGSAFVFPPFVRRLFFQKNEKNPFSFLHFKYSEIRNGLKGFEIMAAGFGIMTETMIPGGYGFRYCISRQWQVPVSGFAALSPPLRF